MEQLPLLLCENVDFIRLCQLDRHCSGSFDPGHFPRLAASPGLERLCGPIGYELHFGVDLQGLHVLEGRLTAACELTCQRCCTGFPAQLTAELHLSCDERRAQRLRLTAAYDFFELDARRCCCLRDLLEDSLMLEIPLVPRHPGECPGTEPQRVSTADGQPPQGGGPWAALEALRRRDRS